MKGFKSFADSTTLEFEPGVTAVVGPNGSGKSNVVDAVTWVLGAQSTRALRSQKMDDVIFAGTASRAALGRAEVSLTLDNASGRLPVEGAEVTISRTLFRNGDSEYAINGTVCRLLDIQELLSDSGVGRQQHMIIGQNQLDTILNSSPENRRAVIEEAAGVLKHRRRKERAERRLAHTQENLERLGDLVREVRRQMRPLERQAVSARSYVEVEGQLRVAREALFSRRLHEFAERRDFLDSREREAAERAREGREALVNLDAQASAAAAEMGSRREEALASTLGTLQALAERARGTQSVIAERERALQAALEASADENVVATLEADAARLSEDLEALSGLDLEAISARARADAARARAEEARRRHEEQYSEGSPEVDQAAYRAARDRLGWLERTLAQQATSLHRARSRRDALADEMKSLEARLGELPEQRALLAAVLQSAEATWTNAEQETERCEADREAAQRKHSEATEGAARTQARAEALARALEELSGSNSRAIVEGVEGVLGAFLDLIEVDEGFERAVEAAAGASVSAMVVDGRDSARAALEALRREGGAGVILAAGLVLGGSLETPEGCESLRPRVRARQGAPAHVARVLDALFSRAVVAPSWREGLDVAATHPDLVVATLEGDRFAPTGWRVASGRALVTRATVEEAHESARRAAERVPATREALTHTEGASSAARRSLSGAVEALSRARNELQVLEGDESRTRLALETRGTQIPALDDEVAVALDQSRVLEEELADLRGRLPELADAVENAEARARAQRASLEEVRRIEAEASSAESAAQRLSADVAARRAVMEKRHAEIEARLAGRSRERDEAAQRRLALEHDLVALARLNSLVERALDDVRRSHEVITSTYREQLEASRASAERLEALRRERRAVEEAQSILLEARRRDEVELAELAVKVDGVYEAVRRDLAKEPTALTETEIETPEGVTLENYVGDLEAKITSLGPINPLALEELAELEERYRELDTQVADVRHARREILEVLRALYDEIMTSFSAAVADVNEHFSTLISMLFPGGQGRLILTDPDDPLTTGVEIEVRPMGRNVRRISLLSGGERSMAALAFLFAIFRSRPSPFYMMDEVEAALDDVNLQRFLNLVDEFRHEAQLLIVTHQKRTMESADALYGVTMVPGASSKVVSQRQRREVEVVP